MPRRCGSSRSKLKRGLVRSKVTSFPVHHSPVEPAVGYKFVYKGRSAVISGDTTAKQKPDPEPVWYAMKALGVEQAIMIGDSINDIAAAKNAGIPAICVTYGYGGTPSVDADATIAQFSDLLSMIQLV